ncbi:hypothetical protein DA798_11655 [Lactobacillus sp. PFC-70]|nr:hypothetical protein DA798_11655 [Lactobacillus sp. PFC-70]
MMSEALGGRSRVALGLDQVANGFGELDRKLAGYAVRNGTPLRPEKWCVGGLIPEGGISNRPCQVWYDSYK